MHFSAERCTRFSRGTPQTQRIRSKQVHAYTRIHKGVPCENHIQRSAEFFRMKITSRCLSLWFLVNRLWREVVTFVSVYRGPIYGQMPYFTNEYNSITVRSTKPIFIPNLGLMKRHTLKVLRDTTGVLVNLFWYPRRNMNKAFRIPVEPKIVFYCQTFPDILSLLHSLPSQCAIFWFRL